MCFPTAGRNLLMFRKNLSPTTWQTEARTSPQNSANFHPPVLKDMYMCGHVWENPASAVLRYSEVHRYCGNITRGHVVKSNLMQTAEAVHTSYYCVGLRLLRRPNSLGLCFCNFCRTYSVGISDYADVCYCSVFLCVLQSLR